MKKMNKLLVVLLVVLCFIISYSFIGCKGETVKTEEEKAPIEEAKEEPVEEVTDTEEVITVNILFEDTQDTYLTEQYIDEFYASHPNIKVNFTYLPQKENYEKTRVELAAGSPTYDIVFFDDPMFPTYVTAGWIEPLNSYIERDGYNLDDFFESALNACKDGDIYYSLPFYEESNILYFRYDLFEKYNVEVPETLDEWMDAAKKLTIKDDEGKQIYGVTLRGYKGRGDLDYAFTAYLKAFGSDWLDENYKPIFNNDAGKEAAKWYRDMQNYAPPGMATFTWWECLQAFQQGQAATMCDATVFGAWMEDPEQSTVVGKIGYAMIPAGPFGQHPSQYISMYGINKFSEKKDAAWELLKFVVSDTIAPLITLSPRKSAYETEEVKARFSGKGIEGYMYDKILVDSLAIAERTFPIVPEWGEISSIFSGALSNVLAGGDIDENLDNAAKDVEDLLSEAGYYQ